MLLRGVFQHRQHRGLEFIGQDAECHTRAGRREVAFTQAGGNLWHAAFERLREDKTKLTARRL